MPKDSANLPLVSIACITYNHEKFIEKAIESFLIQKTSFPFEIVIGEDNSLDSTLALCKNYEKKYPDIIRILTTDKNLGMHKNLMRTFNACKGKYIAFCEGDDYWTDENKIRKQADFLNKHGNFFMSFHDTGLIDEKGRIINGSKLNNEYKRDLVKKDLLEGAYIPSPTWMFRNIDISLPKYFKRSINLDSLLLIYFSRFGKAKYQKEIGISMSRIHSAGIWSSKNKWYQLDNMLNTRALMFRYVDRESRKHLFKKYYPIYKGAIEIAEQENNTKYWYRYNWKLIRFLFFNRRNKLIYYYLKKLLLKNGASTR